MSRFRRDVDQICALLGYYAALGGNYLSTFRDNVSVASSWVTIGRIFTDHSTREDGIDTLSRNVGKQLPHDAA